MDKIIVTANALTKARNAIAEFNNEIQQVINAFEGNVDDLISNLDENSGKNVKELLDSLGELKSKTENYYSSNDNALSQRKEKIEEYEKKTYVQNSYII